MDPRRSSIYSTASRRSVSVSGGHRRSRSHSAVRDNVNDVRRHVNSVAQNSQALAEKFTSQLKKYKTFAPIFATDGVYSQLAFPSVLPASSALDQILDSRTSFLVRNASHHRITATGPSSPTSPLEAASSSDRLANLDAGIDSLIQMFSKQRTPRIPQPPSASAWNVSGGSVGTSWGDRTATESEDPLESDPVFRMWLAEHPLATFDERNAEKQRRQKEILVAEQASRTKYFRRWQAELEMALNEDASYEAAKQSAAADGAVPLPPRPPAQPHATYPNHRRRSATNPYEKDMQVLAWDVFNHTNPPGVTEMTELRKLPSLHTTAGGDVQQTALHRWVHGDWRRHTHRHEAAALRIQCAFRCYRAKSILQRARYLRALDLQESLKAEEEAMFAWRVAVEVMRESTTSKGGLSDDPDDVKKTLASIHFFVDSIDAKIRRRRAQKRLKEEETYAVRSFAAVRIQAAFRGHRARQVANELRHPEIGERRREAAHTAAAIAVQRMWRGFAARQRLKRRQAAALRIQCWFRRRTAVARLSELRRNARQSERGAVECFASNRIKRFLARVVGQRRKRYAQLFPQLEVLFHVSSGFRVRKTVARMHWQSLARDAIQIQRVIRGFLARRAVLAIRRQASTEEEERRRHEAAGVIQRNVAFHTRRRRYERHAAARSVQRAYRGSLGRKRAAQAKQAKAQLHHAERMHDAASLIQACYRGARDRKFAATLKVDADVIPKGRGADLSRIRSSYARAAMLRDKPSTTQDDAALMVQDFYFRYIRCRLLRNRLHRAAATLTRLFRRFAGKRELRSQNRRVDAAVSIQIAVRALLARRVTEHLKAERAARHVLVRQHEAATMITCFMRRVATKRKIQRAKLQLQTAC